MSQTVVVIISVFVILVIIAGIFGSNASKKIAKKALILLQSADKKYENFVEKTITYTILSNNDFKLNEDETAKNAIVHIKPEIEGIIGIIKVNSYSSTSIAYQSKYFNSTISTINTYFSERTTKNNGLTDEERKALYDRFEEAIRSDIAQRLLDIKTRSV